jgi:hypothetical protein
MHPVSPLDIWRDLFDLPELTRHDDFYALGGHSVIAVRVTAQLRANLGLRVPVRLILEHPTIADLVPHLV